MGGKVKDYLKKTTDFSWELNNDDLPANWNLGTEDQIVMK